MSTIGIRPKEVATINRSRRPAPVRGAAWARVLPLAVAFALGAIVAGGVVFGLTRPDPIERTADRLRAESALRDKTQIKTLTELARGTRTRLVPVLDGLNRAMPPADGAAGPVAVTDADVETWRQAAAAAVQDFADPPSGETATNVARSSLASAVRQIATTVDTYAAARDLTGPARAAAMDLAVRQRADALFTWSVGATALDALSVDAGHGHQHVFLPTSPGQGALTPDAEPEGSHDS
ncbi:hypothetical protein FH608_027875 [Nonomuraea phyllanthi]|uniref:Uncharacterized protein n=1 Tax=Nonomuraea phyllanthi TaxID=2219224 RepID=A0A5C4W475_9ACTN|nr:hypothetical protein [Nonomuraea phyllanthi]KAB8191786.1 hypothetical protein FH608_027875 [Nonomuraea phyllanthi]QFY10132.1 hypothetical protein GBF35_28940 [Nonomuraea phyllanthi]